MGKKLIVILILLLCCGFLFANGGKEYKEVENASSNIGIIGQTLQGIGTVFGSATKSIVLALHPFPNVLTSFYGFVDGKYTSTYDGTFDSDMLLTSKNYYTNSKYSQTGKDERTGQAQVTIAGSEDPLVISETDTGTGELQKRRWTVTSYLFVIFFAAEVIFTAVFGYIAPQDENASPLRQIGVSAAMTLMLFILASALPFLLEAVRYGLFQVANLYTPVTFDSMFDMPTKFMWDMAELIETLSWRNDASMLFNSNKTSLTVSLLGSLLAGFIYIIFEFVMGLQAIKAGIHIVANIVEVYLLLSIVMVLLPISVFTPLKGVTRKCVYSLFSNLIECFVLCFIIILVVPACISGCANLESITAALENLTANKLEFRANEVISFKDKKSVDVSWTLVFYAQSEDDYVTVVSWAYPEGSGSYAMYLDKNSAVYAPYADSTYSVLWSEANYEDMAPSSLKYDYEARETYFENKAKEMLSLFRYASHGFDPQAANRPYLLEMANNLEKYDGLPTASDCTEAARNYAQNIMDNPKTVETDETYNTNANLISSLLIAWVFLYLPCFFVMQSTQITNALSNGTAGHESFANALSHTGGQMMQAATMGANLVKNGVAMAAGASGMMASKGMAADISSIHDAMQKEANKDAGSNENSTGGQA